MRVTGIFRDIEDISDAPEPYFMPSSGFVDRWGDDVAHLTGTALVNTDPRRVEEVVASLQDAVGPYFAVAPAVDQDDFAKRGPRHDRCRSDRPGRLRRGGRLDRPPRHRAGAGAQRWQLDDGPADPERDRARPATSGPRHRRDPRARDRPRRARCGAADRRHVVAVPPWAGPSWRTRTSGVWVDAPVVVRRRGPRAADRGHADALDELAHRSGWCPDPARARPALRGRRPPGRFRARRARARGPLRAGARPPPGSGRRPGRDRGRRGARRRARRRRHHRTLPRPPPRRGPPVRRRLGPADGPLRESTTRRPCWSSSGTTPTSRRWAPAPRSSPTTARSRCGATGAARWPSPRPTSGPRAPGRRWCRRDGRRAPARPPSAPSWRDRLHAGIGDTVVVEGYDGDVALRVTGWFVDPGTDELDAGLVVTRDTLEAMRAHDCPSGDDVGALPDRGGGRRRRLPRRRRPRGRSGAAAEVPAGPGARADPFDRGQPGRRSARRRGCWPASSSSSAARDWPTR